MTLLAPTELYLWRLGSQTIREATSMFSVSHDGHTWTPAAITRGQIERGTDLDRASLTVDVPHDHEVAAQFRALPPDTASLEIWRKRSGSYVRIWTGRVVSVEWRGLRAAVTCEPPITVARQRGLQAGYQASCRHRFGDHRCLAQNGRAGSATESVAFVQTYTVESVAGFVVTLTGLASFVADRVADYPENGANWYVGGELRFAGQRRFVVSHDGDAVTLNAPVPSLAVSDTVQLVTGCSHTLAECNAKFRNAENYGGFPFVPLRNPHAGRLD